MGNDYAVKVLKGYVWNTINDQWCLKIEMTTFSQRGELNGL